jgi:maleylpyruvate isomerase
MTTLRFHGYWRSSAAWRCRIAFALKGLSPEHVPVHLVRDGGEQHGANFAARNPQQLIPVLEVDGAVLTQSLAIIEWLEETRPEPPLLPRDPLRRAAVRAFALAIACEIHPLQNLRVQQYLRREGGFDPAAVQAWLERWIGSGLAACEGLLAGEPAGQAFAFGDTPSLADIVLAPQLASAERFKVDVSALPRLTALGRTYAEHPAFVLAHADNQPDREAP